MGRAAGAERGIKRGLLLIGGAGPGKDTLALVAKGMDLIVAADSGLEPALAGGGSGRIDHLLGIAVLFERAAPPARWLMDYEEVRLVEREAEFGGWLGCTVSIFPVGRRAARMRSEGLQWPLDGLVFRPGFGGMSNRATAARVRITVGVGRLLVMRSFLSDAGHRMALNDTGYRVDLDDKDF